MTQWVEKVARGAWGLSSGTVLAPWLDQLLVCPRHCVRIRRDGDRLLCERGDSYPVVSDVPVLLCDELEPTHPGWWTRPSHIVGFREGIAPFDARAFVQRSIVATCGQLYTGLRGEFRYPIPALRMPPGEGALFLDLGGNWGRWAIAAARAGYRAVCVDASLEAAVAGRQIAKELGVDVEYIVGDGRCLPLRESAVDVAFSYSVLQHLSVGDVRRVLGEVARVTRRDGVVRVQMPNVLGVRQATNLVRRLGSELVHRLRTGHWPERWVFHVRPWTLPALRREFERAIGPVTFSVDGFFSLNAQAADLDLLSPRDAAVVQASEALRCLSDHLPATVVLADSVYVECRNGKPEARS